VSTVIDTVTADAPNQMWAVDFQFDATTDGRPIKIVSIVDEHTRECLGGLVEWSITGEDLIAELDRLAGQRGYPGVLRCDNGPELACAALAEWACEHVGRHFIPPGQPWLSRGGASLIWVANVPAKATAGVVTRPLPPIAASRSHQRLADSPDLGNQCPHSRQNVTALPGGNHRRRQPGEAQHHHQNRQNPLLPGATGIRVAGNHKSLCAN
jgi:transposase InsO family protein